MQIIHNTCSVDIHIDRSELSERGAYLMLNVYIKCTNKRANERGLSFAPVLVPWLHCINLLFIFIIIYIHSISYTYRVLGALSIAMRYQMDIGSLWHFTIYIIPTYENILFIDVWWLKVWRKKKRSPTRYFTEHKCSK